KDHPDVAVEVCRGWLGTKAPEGRKWIVRHALRSLVKNGHAGALGLLGVGGKPQVRVHRVTLAPKRPRLGGELRFGFVVTSTGKAPQELLVDYVVHFVRANGLTRPKVFKLKRLTFAPSAQVELSGKISFRDMTTRKHRPGRHRIELLINGVVYPLAEFNVRAR